MNQLQIKVLLNTIDRATGPLKKITGGSQETARALKAARDRLKELNTQQKDIGAWRTQRTAADQTKQSLDAARERVKALSQQFTATGAPTRAMTRDFRAAVREAQRLKQEHQQQGVQLQGLRSRLYDAGINTKNLSSHERQLREQIGATNNAISEQGRRLRALNAHQERMAKARAGIDNTYSRRKQFAGNAAMAGAAGMGAGYAIGRGLYAPLQEGKHFALEEQLVASLGLGKEDTSKAINFAKEMKTYGTSVTENLTLVRDAMSIFADEHHAEMVAPTLAKMKFANEAMYGETQGEDNERKFMDMLKVIELRGGLASEEAFKAQANIVQKVLTATGGRVTPDQWLQVIARGGIAAKGLTNDAFYYQMEPLVQEMKGSAVGAGMSAAYQNLYQGRTTKRAANNLEQLGLVNPAMVKHDKAGQIAFLDVGALKGGDLFRSNQFEWLEKVLLPQLASKGITDHKKVVDTIGSLFSNPRGANFFAQMYMQREQIHKNAKLNAGADGIDQLYDKGLDSVQGQELELLAQRANAYREMSSAILPTYVAALKSVTETIKGITAWMKENPAAAAVMTKTLMWVGALAVSFGALALTLAGLLGPFAVISYGLALFGLKGGGATKMFQRLAPTLTGLARNAFPMLAQGVRMLASTLSGVLLTALRTVSIALWGLATNPVALAIGAVVVAIAGGAYLIYKNWDAVKGYFLNAWAEINAGFSGGISGIIKTLVNFSPLGLIYQAFAGVLGYLGINLPTRLTELGQMIINGLGNGISAGYEAIKMALAPVAQVLTSGASLIYQSWDAVKNYFTASWAEIQVGFGNGVAGVIATLTNFSPLGLVYQAFAGVLNYLGVELPSRFTEFGGMIVNGLVNGLLSGLGLVKDTIVSIGDSTIGWFKEKLGIHSPSRVFAELGGFTMAGLAQGLEDGQKGPLNALTQITRKLVSVGDIALGTPAIPNAPLGLNDARKQFTGTNQRVLEALPAAPNNMPLMSGLGSFGKTFATAGALALGSLSLPALAIDNRPPIATSTPPVAMAAPSEVTIHVHAAPGMDEGAIAREVAKQVDRILRAKEVRQRSLLKDLE